ncbi:hypothetical protein ISCGN_009786 [Ixodes scapularis]
MGMLFGLAVLFVFISATTGRPERRQRPQEQRDRQQPAMGSSEQDELMKKGDECMAQQEFSNEEIAAIQKVESSVMADQQGQTRNDRNRPESDRQQDQYVLQKFFSTIDTMFDQEMSQRLKQKLQKLADCIQGTGRSG